MNEPSTSCAHSCNKEKDVPEKSLQNDMFYIPGGGDLNAFTIPIDIKHNEIVSELDAHSSFGHLQSKSTYEFLAE
jgi:alpha-glucosidase